MPKATAPSPQPFDDFGSSVSISGDWAIVGNPSEGNNNAGAAYFFHWNGFDWETPPERVAPDEPTPGEHFGGSVALYEDRAIVGSLGEAAYLFHKNGNNWGPQLAKLTASAGQNGDNFGNSVSVSGDIALVGAPGYMEDAGAAYPFHWNGTAWMEFPKITAEDYLAGDSESGDGFGQSVCADQDRIIVGALGDNEWAGAAYISAIVPCGPMRPASAAISLSAKAKTTFTLYPNPALEEVFLEFKTPLASAAEVWVYDLAGRPVLRRTLEEGTDWIGIPIEEIAPGLYLVEVKSGERVFEVKRFVKGED